MSDWQFEITRDAEEDLDALDRPVRRRVIEKLEWFVGHFEEVSPIPLTGYWSGYFKLRVGDWRIIYELQQDLHCIVIHSIGRRDEIYKRKK